MTEKVKKSKEPNEGKSTEGGDFVPEFKTIKIADSNEKYFKRGGIGEFYHTVGEYIGAVGLLIPIDKIKDINYAIKKAGDEGFRAEVRNYNVYAFLEIYKQGYNKEDDQQVVEKLKNVAIEVSKEDYSNHIENLNFQITRGNNIAQNDSLIHTTVKELEMLCKVLGIPVVSSAKELNSYSIVIFASKHDHYNTEPKEIKEILLQKLNNGKKIILGFEFYSDEYFVNLLNDPKRNLNDDTLNELLSLMLFRETVKGLVEAINEIQQKYSRDRFEIKPFDVTYAESLEKLKDREKEKEYYEKRDAQVVKNILDLLKTYGDNNLVFYTGMFHVIDLLTELKEIIKSGNKEGIKINNVSVFVPPENIIQALRSIKRD